MKSRFPYNVYMTYVAVLWFSPSIHVLVVIWRMVPSLLPERGKNFAGMIKIYVSLKCICDVR